MDPLQQARYRTRIINASTAILLILGLLLVVFRDQIIVLIFGASWLSILEGRYDLVRRQTFIIGLALLATAFFLFLLRYLRGELSIDIGSFSLGFKQESKSPFIESTRISELEEQVKRIKIAVARQISPSATAAIENVEAALIERVIQEVPNKLAEQLNENTVRQRSIVQTRDGLNLGRKRLEIELASLDRRGTVNLSIGSVTSAVAVVLLYQAATTSPQSTDLMTLFTFYVPRVALAIFVELFSFFFLRLYKAGLLDLKYFHSEILNLELRIAALDTAMLINDQESLRNVISSLVETDRTKQLNFEDASKQKNDFDEKSILNVVEAALKLAKTEK